MNGLGYFLVVWMVMVSNVGADVRSAMDSVFVDVIKGNYYGAMVRCEDVIAADSTAVDAQRFLGWLQIATKQGDLRTAGECLRQAVALRPEDAGAHNDLGFVYAFQQNYGPAMEVLQRAVALQPDEALFHRNLGFVAERAGDYSVAESAFQAVLEHNPIDDLAVYGFGLALAKQARYDEALEAFQKAVQMFSERKEAYSEMGKIRMMQGDYPAAATAYERAKKIDFEDPTHHYALAQVYRQLGDSLRAEQAWETFKYFDNRHRYSVRDQYILPVQFDQVADLLDRGGAFARLGRHEEALVIYNQALSMTDRPESAYRFSPEVPLVHLAIGQSHQALGQVDDARLAYDAARAFGEGNMVSDEATMRLADQFLCTEGLSGDTLQGYERIVAMDPTSHTAFWIYDQMSQAQAKAGNLNRCIEMYRAKEDQAMYSAGLVVRLGVAYAVSGNLEAATVMYENVIAGASDPSELYLQLSILYRRAGWEIEAEELAAKAKQK